LPIFRCLIISGQGFIVSLTALLFYAILMLWTLIKNSLSREIKNNPKLSAEEISKLLEEAVVKRQSGQLQEAESICKSILESQADHAYALYILGLLNLDVGNYIEASELIIKALEANSNEPAFYNSCGEVFWRLGDNKSAINYLKKAVEINPDYPEAHCNLGNSYSDLGLIDDAILSYEKALQIKPDYAIAYSNLGSIFFEQERYDEAIKYFEDAISYNSAFAEAHKNLGSAFLETGQYDNAIKSFKDALLYKPDFVEAHVSLAVVYLMLGKYKEGWKEYEWRFDTKITGPQREFTQPKWDGSSLNNKTIFLHAEQGLGDTIQFIRYVPMVAKLGGNVIVECAPGIIHLFNEYKDIAEFVGKGEPLPYFDVHCPLLSLPGIFNTTYETIPSEVNYIHANENLVASWKEKLSNTTKMKVGICWQGDKIYYRDKFRSIALKQFENLLSVSEIEFISLQKGEGQEQIDECGFSNHITDYTAEMDNQEKFADTLAIMQNLDLVIGVDTSIIHLAGAMGKPVWVLLATFPSWPWLLDHESTPWYPSMRFFRQNVNGDWASVINNVTEALAILRDKKT
jgi:tetratricopeptide (TPR) repeat protein